MGNYFSIFTGSQIDEKLTGAFAGIHTHDNTTPQSIPTGTTYTKIINWGDNDVSVNATPDATNGQITSLKTGIYRLEGSFSLSSGTANIITWVAPFINGVEFDSIHFKRKISTAGDVGSAALSGIVSLSENDVVDIRARHNNAGSVNLTFEYMNFSISRIDI